MNALHLDMPCLKGRRKHGDRDGFVLFAKARAWTRQCIGATRSMDTMIVLAGDVMASATSMSQRTEMQITMTTSPNPTIALRLQSTSLAGRFADSLGRIRAYASIHL
jgi:hypothetical protein